MEDFIETTEGMELPDTLFAEDTIPTEEVEEPAQTTPETEPEPPQEEPEKKPEGKSEEPPQEEPPHMTKIPLKVNHKTMEVTPEELKAYAQKGVDYDRIRQERDTLKNAPEKQVLEKLASASGKTLAQYMEEVEGLLSTAEVNRRVAELTNANPDLSEEAAKHVVKKELEAERVKLESEKVLREQREASEKRTQAQLKHTQEVNRFLERYPKVKAQSLSKEVIADANESGRLLEAYQRHEIAARNTEIKELKDKVAALENNKKNKEKAPGSLESSGPEGTTDPFLQGLFGE